MTSISFIYNDKMLVSASSDNTVRLWNFNGRVNTLPNRDEINTISFSPDSQTLVSASKQGAIKIWSRDKTLLKTLIQPDPKIISDAINSVVFSPDGKTIASASSKESMIWNLDLDNLMRRACDLLGDYLRNNPNVSKSDRALCHNVGS